MPQRAKKKNSGLSNLKVDYDLARKLPLSFVKRYKVVPIKRLNGAVSVGAVKGSVSPQVIDDLSAFYNADVKLKYLGRELLTSLITDVYYGEREAASGIIDGLKKQEPSLTLVTEETKDLLESTEEGPVIAFVNSLLSEAISKRASDIHIEPFESEIRVRNRIDGVLYNTLSLPKPIFPNISSRIKVMAALDVAEKRMPQDGRIRVKIGGSDVDIRVSTFPTSFGERIVLRLLHRKDSLLSLEEIGFEKDDIKTFLNLIHRDHGLILVTGPTGAGKTTTLYGALSRINTESKNILTIEDPIEYQLSGVGQMQVNPKIGLAFSTGLRHMLRQDPDVIMVGEIRDRETAEIAIHASLTGHLVFSTLHTDDASGAIARLVDMGVEPYLVSSALIAVVAQRLIRVLCPKCKAKDRVVSINGKGPGGSTAKSPAENGKELSVISEEKQKLDKKEKRVEELFSSWCSKVVKTGGLRKGELTLYKSVGCDSCFDTGYYGRTGIYELLVMNDSLRRLVVSRCDSSEINEMALREGMTSLKKNGLKKVLKGITTLEEIVRVIQVSEA